MSTRVLNSVEGLRDFWLLIDAGKIENRKTLFFSQQCAHLSIGGNGPGGTLARAGLDLLDAWSDDNATPHDR
jgi:hypothetical protein